MTRGALKRSITRVKRAKANLGNLTVTVASCARVVGEHREGCGLRGAFLLMSDNGYLVIRANA